MAAEMHSPILAQNTYLDATQNGFRGLVIDLEYLRSHRGYPSTAYAALRLLRENSLDFTHLRSRARAKVSGFRIALSPAALRHAGVFSPARLADSIKEWNSADARVPRSDRIPKRLSRSTAIARST
jgi:hypothetical protein